MLNLYLFNNYDQQVIVEIEDGRMDEVKRVLDETWGSWHLRKVSEGGAKDAMSADELIEWSKDTWS